MLVAFNNIIFENRRSSVLLRGAAMDYEIPENIRMMVETVRRFVKQDLEPISNQVEEEDLIPDDIVQKMRDLGLFGIGIPEEYGGLGLGCLVNV